MSYHVVYRTDSPQLRFAVEELVEALHDDRISVSESDIKDISQGDLGKTAIVIATDASQEIVSHREEDCAEWPALEEEGFRILTSRSNDRTTISVIAPDQTGAMYGTLDLVEQLRMNDDLKHVEEKATSPTVPFRAVKFNLPWSPYRGGDQTDIHLDVCKDLDFWRQFLDMMARNRFNVLSLWNLHPFHYLIRSERFPEACPFSAEELAEWKDFWHSLFRMAKERGIETYLVTWNIVVPAGFAEAYDVEEYNDTSQIVKEYTRDCVTEIIDEYENLTGLGTTLADWMGGMNAKEKQNWLEETFIKGIERASRPITFLDRSVRTESIDEMRRIIDDAADIENVSEIWVPSKFNWSHGHSTTNLEMTHDYRSGEVDDRLWNPKPENYQLAWMIRNEDFFILRWGDPEFIREHLAKNFEGKEYVGGYFVGSEAYIPAKEYTHRTHKHQTWQYAFERQWLFYKLWGRLLYNPETPDDVFEIAFETRYGDCMGKSMLRAYSLGSQMPLELASFHAGTWDYTLYAEGFLAPVETQGIDDGISPFISIEELIDHEPLDSHYLSIPKYVQLRADGAKIEEDKVTPLELADRLTESGTQCLNIGSSLFDQTPDDPGAVECEIFDIMTWGHLSLYFADKLRAGVEFETYRETGRMKKPTAISLLERAADHWDRVVQTTKSHYREVPYATDWWTDETFSWKKYTDQVQRDIEIVKQARPYDYEKP